MKKPRNRVRIVADGVEGFWGPAAEHARKLDAGEELAPELTISFENADDMMRILSSERVRLLKEARVASAVSELASHLKRDTRAVSRDVDLLEQFGLLQSDYVPNPGHGKKRVVSARAMRYQLVVNI